MSDYEFFYGDIRSTLAILNRYKLGDWVHANNGVYASRLKGGLLSGCNVRVAYIPHPEPHIIYRQEDQDYKNQQMIIFEEDLRFCVLDKYQRGDVAQILMSPAFGIEDSSELEDIIQASRDDFDKSLMLPSAHVLDNSAWKNKVAIIPGVDGKNSPLKGFMTEYWK